MRRCLTMVAVLCCASSIALAAGAAPEKKPAEPPFSAQTMDQALSRKVTLQFRDASIRSIFDVLSKTSGFNVVFDKDVAPDLKATVFLRDTSVRAAIDKVALTTQLAWRMLDENTLLVYSDEPVKQRDYQTLQVRSFHLSNADAKFVANSLKTVLKFKDVVVDEKLNMLVMRDTAEALAQAERLIALHDVPEPEVMLEVEVLEVNRNFLQNIGLEWPSSISLAPLPTSMQSVANGYSYDSSLPVTVRDVTSSVRDHWGVTGLSAVIKARAEDGDVKTLANPRIRAKSRERAKILIGKRVPTITATTTSNGVISGNVNYIDVGLKLEVEPQVLPDEQVNIKVALEVSTIADTVTTGSTVAYTIGTRNATTVLRLKDGENQVLAGLIQDEDRKTSAKIPLLGEIPLLGRLFGSQRDEKNKTEIILSITPRLIRGIQRPASDAASFDAGTISSVRGRRPEGDPSVPGADAPSADSDSRRDLAPRSNPDNGARSSGNGNGG